MPSPFQHVIEHVRRVSPGYGGPDRVAIIDFETRSDIDLKKAGVHRYAESPHASASCLSWCFDDGEIEGVDLLQGPCACPPELAEHIAAGGVVVAHNAPFELAIWAMLVRRDALGEWPVLAPEQTVCTMATARALSLPASLDDVSRVLRLRHKKDKAGHALMMRLCKPRKPGKKEPAGLYWNESPEDLARQLEYCCADVAAERDLLRVLPMLSDFERRVWLLDQKINNTGIAVDLAAVGPAIELTSAERERLNGELYVLTGRAVRTVGSNKKFREWLETRECKLGDLRKDTVENALEDMSLDGAARRALEIRQEASKSSVAKLSAMAAGVCADGRLRALLEYHVASTGRWAGKRVQPQNMLRTPKGFKVTHAHDIIEALKGGASVAGWYVGAFYGSLTAAVAHAMRSFLRAAPGCVLVANDYSNIEGRDLAWLGGEEWKLSAFRDYDTLLFDADGRPLLDAKGEHRRKGPDLYVLAFARAFGIPVENVDELQRQIGKVMELALGYQGGHGAFISMAKNYRLNLETLAEATRHAVTGLVWDDALAQYWRGAREEAEEILAERRLKDRLAEEAEDDELARGNGGPPLDEDAELADLAAEIAKSNRHGLSPEVWAAIRILVDSWRAAHPQTVALWRGLNDAAIAAVRQPGAVASYGRVKYAMHGKDRLLCRLPSGRCLSYPFPVLKEEISPWTGRTTYRLEYEGVSSKTRKWQRQKAYGGLLAENVTQAVARDQLAAAMLRLDAAGFKIVLHVHDEIVCEMPAGRDWLTEMSRLMAMSEPWATGAPIAVAGWQGERYRKG